MKKVAMNLKESKDGYMGGFGRREERGKKKMMQFYHNLSNNINF